MLGFNQSASEIAAGERCAYRCWFAAGDNDAREGMRRTRSLNSSNLSATLSPHLILGAWTQVAPGRVAQPECDVLDAHCAYDAQNLTSYKFLHSQIYERRT